MKTFIYSIALLLFSINNISAQKATDAQTIINEISSSLNTTTIKTDFELIISDKNQLNSQSNQGSFTMKAQKFVLEMTDAKVWFDGKTQWAYMPQTNEVSITEPTEDELSSINPMAILYGYAAKSDLNFSKLKSTENYIIDMTPRSTKDDFSKIEVQISKNSKQLKSIKMSDKNGSTTLLKLTNYRKDNSISADFFQFNKTQYKNAFINDLR